MASQEKYLRTVLNNNTTLLSTKVLKLDDACWRYSNQQAKTVSFSRHGIQHDWKDTIFGLRVYVSPGSAETLVRGGGITIHHLIAYSLRNIFAEKLLKSVDVRWSYSVQHQTVSFFRDTV